MYGEIIEITVLEDLVYSSIQISQQIVTNLYFNNVAVFSVVKTWNRTNVKPFREQIVILLTDVYAQLGLKSPHGIFYRIQFCWLLHDGFICLREFFINNVLHNGVLFQYKTGATP